MLSPSIAVAERRITAALGPIGRIPFLRAAHFLGYTTAGAQGARHTGEFPLPIFSAPNGRLYVTADALIELYAADLEKSGFVAPVPEPIPSPVAPPPPTGEKRGRGRPRKIQHNAEQVAA